MGIVQRRMYNRILRIDFDAARGANTENSSRLTPIGGCTSQQFKYNDHVVVITKTEKEEA